MTVSKKLTIEELYDSALKQLLEYLQKELSSGNFDPSDTVRMDRMLKHTAEITAKLDNRVQHEVDKIIREVFSDKFKGTQYLKNPETYRRYLLASEQKIKYLSGSVMSDLAAATDHTEMKIKQMIREIFQKQTATDVLTGKGLDETVDDIWKAMQEQGFSKYVTDNVFVGLVDAAGRRWELKRYVDTVIRTKLMEADIETDRAMGLASDIDLAYISHHNAKDACSKWEWVLISMNGLTAGFPTYEEVKATKECFHPNCEHHLNPVRSYELITQQVISRTEKQLGINVKELLTKKSE